MAAPQLTAQIQGQGTVSADQLNTYGQWCVNVTQLRNFIGLPYMEVFLEGLVSPGDGGQGIFYWNPTSLGPDNGTTIIVPQPGVPGAWVMILGQPIYGPGIVGEATSVIMSIPAASSMGTLTASQIIVGTTLTGLTYKLGDFDKTITLTIVGAGGMDTGLAPISGYVAIYAIYNPFTNAYALLGTNSTSSIAPDIYGGANLPGGYTASALVSVWPTNASREFVEGHQTGRLISITNTTVLTSSTTQASILALSISAAVPMNAKLINGNTNVANNGNFSSILNLYPSDIGFGGITIGATISGFSLLIPYNNLQITNPQFLYYNSTSTGGVVAFSISISSYSF